VLDVASVGVVDAVTAVVDAPKLKNTGFASVLVGVTKVGDVNVVTYDVLPKLNVVTGVFIPPKSVGPKIAVPAVLLIPSTPLNVIEESNNPPVAVVVAVARVGVLKLFLFKIKINQ
jgi:hypothetical protein